MGVSTVRGWEVHSFDIPLLNGQKQLMSERGIDAFCERAARFDIFPPVISLRKGDCKPSASQLFGISTKTKRQNFQQSSHSSISH